MTRSLFDVRPSWHADALCQGLTDLFFPEKGDRSTGSVARQLCAQCPVRAECLDAGRSERFGVWGGTNIKQRRRPPRNML